MDADADLRHEPVGWGLVGTDEVQLDHRLVVELDSAKGEPLPDQRDVRLVD